MITPKITVGVSYSPSETTYDRMFVYTYQSCSPMTTHKMMMRVRHLKNNEVLILFQPPNVLNRCKNILIQYEKMVKFDNYNDSIKQNISKYLHFLLKKTEEKSKFQNDALTYCISILSNILENNNTCLHNILKQVIFQNMYEKILSQK